jgi:hypothetical protein
MRINISPWQPFKTNKKLLREQLMLTKYGLVKLTLVHSVLMATLILSPGCVSSHSSTYLTKQIEKKLDATVQEERAKRMPQVVAFKLDREEVFEGENATLSWNTYQADNVTIDQGIGLVVAAGQQMVIPPASAQHDCIYILTAANKYGQTTARQRVVVMKEDQPPAIMFEITPAKVKSTLMARMEWSVGGARTISVDKGIGDLTKSYGEKLIKPVTGTYTLTATNKAGTSTRSVSIEVMP